MITGSPHFEFVSMAGPDTLVESDAKTTPNFQPTEYELFQLVRHWADVVIEEGVGQDGRMGVDPFRQSYAYDRVEALCKVIGDKKRDELWAEQLRVVGQRYDFEYWRVLWHGTEEEQRDFEYGTEPLDDRDPIFAVPTDWDPKRSCDLHNRLTGEMTRRTPERWNEDCFWLKYGPWKCPDCHTQVRWALRERYSQIENFDPEKTAELLREVVPPRKYFDYLNPVSNQRLK
jgi:hypothetical protein